MNEITDIPYWLALAPKSIMPIPKLEKIFNQCNSLEPLWKETPEILRQYGLNDFELTKLIEYRKNAKLDYYRDLAERLKEHGIAIVRYVDNQYPMSLKDFGSYHIKPPLVLLVKGSMSNVGMGVAIVGTRKCSFHGHTMARKILELLRKRGTLCIVALQEE